MTDPERLVVPASIWEDIVAHARDHAPRECCGIIAGKDGVPAQVHRLVNLEPGVDRYRIDDDELYRVYWQIENRGEELLAIYHSHPVTAAWPSKTDVELASWPEAVYIICSLQAEEAPVIRGFRIGDGEISEIELG